MELSGEFRRATFGGFNRKEVLNYIEQLNIRTNEAQTKLDKKISELSDSVIDLEKENQSLKEKTKELEDELSTRREKQVQLFQENTELKEKIEKAEESLKNTTIQLTEKSKELEEKISVLSQIQARSAQLQSQLEEKNTALAQAETKLQQAQALNGSVSGKIQELEEKSEKYDEFSHQLGAVFLDAHKRADLVLDQALAQAEELANSTNTSAKEIIGDFVSLQENVGNIRSNVNTSLDVMNRQLSFLTKELENVIQRLQTGVPIKHEIPPQEIRTPEYIEKAMEEVESASKISRNIPTSPKKTNSIGKSNLFEGLFRREK